MLPNKITGETTSSTSLFLKYEELSGFLKKNISNTEVGIIIVVNSDARVPIPESAVNDIISNKNLNIFGLITLIYVAMHSVRINSSEKISEKSE